MADGDDQFRIGVQHGFDDEPRYTWQDPFYQERYDAGYGFGQFQRITMAKTHGISATRWDEFEAMMQRRGLVRTRS